MVGLLRTKHFEFVRSRYPLRDQIVSTEELRVLLRHVDLEDLMDPSPSETAAAGAIGAMRNWDATLTLSQRQRLAIARLLYHQPRFAVLDECTSTLSEDMAERIYRMCATAGITVVSVSHRPRHKRFHAKILTLRGKGVWDVTAIDDDALAQATPPATPRTSPSLMPSLPPCIPSCVRIADGASSESSQADAEMPRVSTLRRLAIVLRICVPKLSLTDRGTQLVCIHVAFILFNVFLTSKVLASLPGKLIIEFEQRSQVENTRTRTVRLIYRG